MSPTESTVQADEAPDWAYGVGEVLDDRYEIHERIARGAYGEVHAATDRETGDRVALKVLRTDSEQRDPKAVARMRQEAEILRALEHPNLVDVGNVLRIDGRECIVMELLEGRSLRELIDDGDLAEPSRATRTVGQILSALDAMHQRGVQHRDLKPDNIIVESAESADHEVVKLVDFGIAKASDFLDQDHEQTLVETREDGFVGTPQYAAPEQAVGDPIDATSDLFSLGLVISEWFTGTPRIEVSDRRGVVSVLIQPDPLDVSDCPEDWQPWLSRMMAKSPDDRFQSAKEALDALPGADEDFDERETWPEEGGPETVDLDASDLQGGPSAGLATDSSTGLGADSSADAESSTGLAAESDAAAPVGDETSGPVETSDTPRSESNARGPTPPAREGSQRSRSWEHRGDVDFEDETESGTDAASSDDAIWFTLASVLFFLFSLAVFIYSLTTVL